jgi:crotonobetainyl-CoA:carnitine CoA-transferase CaiB-like acyl-CoA transferase
MNKPEKITNDPTKASPWGEGNANDGPLWRVCVIDLTHARAGPTCARQLSDWGARVIKVELPSDEEDLAAGARHSSDFQNLHRNKMGLALNLKDPEGLALLKDMVKQADVVIENFRPGVKHRLGIDYDALKTINPRLIYGSLSGFGQTGPYADRPGVDQILQGMGGLMSITGLKGQGPVRVGIPICDLTAGIFLAYGIMIALYDREHSGQGQWVTTSLLQAIIQMLDFQGTRWTMDQEVPPQEGNDHPTGVPTSTYKTKDGHINIAATGEKVFKRLADAFGKAEWLTDEKFSRAKQRRANRAAMNAAIADITVTRTSAEWVELLNKAGVPCGPIYSIDQTFTDPQVKLLDMVHNVTHHKRGKIDLVGQAVKMSRSKASLRTAAPDPGEHSDQILGRMGLSKERIADLRKRHVV